MFLPTCSTPTVALPTILLSRSDARFHASSANTMVSRFELQAEIFVHQHPEKIKSARLRASIHTGVVKELSWRVDSIISDVSWTSTAQKFACFLRQQGIFSLTKSHPAKKSVEKNDKVWMFGGIFSMQCCLSPSVWLQCTYAHIILGVVILNDQGRRHTTGFPKPRPGNTVKTANRGKYSYPMPAQTVERCQQT